MYANTVSCYDQEVVHTSCQINFPFSFRKSNKIEKGICSLLRNCWFFFFHNVSFIRNKKSHLSGLIRVKPILSYRYNRTLNADLSFPDMIYNLLNMFFILLH